MAGQALAADQFNGVDKTDLIEEFWEDTSSTTFGEFEEKSKGV